ncbi:MAG: acyl-CoA thioester hydrolase/BAAT C-terminal domain-containing protein [Eubacteriales bacterium]|nr:acyl-CoA thioester hydrolase/BAAT C-terminal domain-containing protein [Eubacteriales bacterium]
MKKYNVKEHGFEGVLIEAGGNAEKKCMILNLMFAPHSVMMKKTEQWLAGNDISVLSLASWGTKQTVPDENLVPLDYLFNAVNCLKKNGYEKIGVVGLSMGAVMSLYGAALCSDITLTIAISGFDMLFEGVLGRGSQYPSGHSTLTLKGKELPFQPFYLDKNGYQNEMKAAKKEHGETYGRSLWEKSIQKRKNEEAMIPVEKIKGKILFLSAKHDTCWDSASAAERMKKRIHDLGGSAEVSDRSYEHATHMLYPETVPFINFMTKMVFKEAKKYPNECKQSRADVSKEILKAVKEW